LTECRNGIDIEAEPYDAGPQAGLGLQPPAELPGAAPADVDEERAEVRQGYLACRRAGELNTELDVAQVKWKSETKPERRARRPVALQSGLLDIGKQLD
jgi:hypothetical protein